MVLKASRINVYPYSLGERPKFAIKVNEPSAK